MKKTECCNDDCLQSDACPIYLARAKQKTTVRHVRAGGPPPTELPPLANNESKPSTDGGMSTVTLILALTTIFCFSMAALNLAWGNVSFAFLWG